MLSCCSAGGIVVVGGGGIKYKTTVLYRHGRPGLEYFFPNRTKLHMVLKKCI